MKRLEGNRYTIFNVKLEDPKNSSTEKQNCILYNHVGCRWQNSSMKNCSDLCPLSSQPIKVLKMLV